MAAVDKSVENDTIEKWEKLLGKSDSKGGWRYYREKGIYFGKKVIVS